MNGAKLNLVKVQLNYISTSRLPHDGWDSQSLMHFNSKLIIKTLIPFPLHLAPPLTDGARHCPVQDGFALQQGPAPMVHHQGTCSVDTPQHCARTRTPHTPPTEW